MNRKKGIISLCIIVLVMMVVGSYLSRGYLPPAPDNLKREMLQELKRLCPNVTVEPYVWFDENGGKRDPGVCRYFGTYGDCAVILSYRDNSDYFGNPEDPPWPLLGLTRYVELPVKCAISLFNYNADCKMPDSSVASRYCDLVYVKTAELEWLTDAQLEKLSKDLETWVAAGNY